MIRVIRSAALLSALLAFAVPSAAQDALNKRVSLDLKAMAPRDAFKVIATAIGYTVDVAPEVSTPVDIVVGNITAKTALNTICESIGCAWQVTGTVIGVKRGGPALRVPSAGSGNSTPAAGTRQTRRTAVHVEDLRRRLDQVLPADMKFENTPIAQVAERLSKATGFEITLSADTKPAQTFSADLSNRPFSAAMTAISQQLKGSMICIIRMSRDDTGKLMLISFRIGSAAGPAKRD